MPKSGIWQQTKKIKSVMAVHSTFSRNWIFLSGFWISGSILQKGLTNSRNLTEKRKKNRENTTASNCLATSRIKLRLVKLLENIKNRNEMTMKRAELLCSNE